MTDELVRYGEREVSERLPDYLQILADSASRYTWPALQNLPDQLEGGEPLIALGRAIQAGTSRGVVTALTDRRIVFVSEGVSGRVGPGALTPPAPSPPLSLDLSGWRVETKQGRKGLAVALQKDGREVKLNAFGPLPEAHRILLGLGAQPATGLYEALPEGFPTDPGRPPVATLGDMALYEDRVIDTELRHLPFNGDVSAIVDSAGNIAVTRGRNLAAKGLGTLAFGPIGLFFMGNAKERVTDARELYLLIEGPDWAFTQAFHPDQGERVRSFAQAVTLAARRHGGSSDELGSGSPGRHRSVADEIRELGALRDEGLLTDEEFEAQKARLLKG